MIIVLCLLLMCCSATHDDDDDDDAGCADDHFDDNDAGALCYAEKFPNRRRRHCQRQWQHIMDASMLDLLFCVFHAGAPDEQ